MSQRIKDTKQSVSIDRFGKVVRKTEETPTSFKKLAFIRSGNTEGGKSNTNTEGKIINNYFVKKNAGDILASWDNVEFSRSTSASFWPPDYGIDDKTLYWYPPNVVRTASLAGGEKAILREKIKINNIPQSEDFTTWTINLSASVDANVSGSPDPEKITASRLNFSSAAASGILITSSVDPANFTSASVSIFVKGEAGQPKSTFSILVGRKSPTFPTFGPFTASYDEWTRFEAQVDLQSGSFVPEMWIVNGNIADSHSILIYGAQMEFGDTTSVYRTSYIQTSGTEVSKGHDVIYLDTSWDLSQKFSMNIIPAFSSSEKEDNSLDYFLTKADFEFSINYNGSDNVMWLADANDDPLITQSVGFDGRKEYKMIFETSLGIWSCDFEQGLYQVSRSFSFGAPGQIYIGSLNADNGNGLDGIIIGEPKFYKSPFDE